MHEILQTPLGVAQPEHNLGWQSMIKHRGVLRLILLGIFLSSPFFSFLAHGQSREVDSESNYKNRAALYYLGEQDELLIKVNIWGFVQKPGQYMVPSGTDLISLISYAGGPREQANLSRIKVIRNQALLASWRDGGSGNGQLAMNGGESLSRSVTPVESSDTDSVKPTVIEVNVKRFISTGDERLIPELQPGDTVVLEGSSFHFFGKVLDVMAKLAIIAQVYFWITLANR
jgi:hypothetical protein